MLRKCVSLGNLGSASDPTASEIADLYGPATSDGFTNSSFTLESGTPWVRLFVCWNFWWPNPPAPPADPTTTPYPSPLPLPENASRVANQMMHLDRSLTEAKLRGRKVILTTIGYPKWLNGTDPSSTTEEGFSDDNGVLPGDNVLVRTGDSPPNGSTYQPSDHMYERWVFDMMLRYHPGNPLRPVPGASIDAFELANEPNLSIPNGRTPQPPAGVPRLRHRPSQDKLAGSAALMMRTARRAKASLNQTYEGPNLRLLGPATADVGEWKYFSQRVIDRLVAANNGPIRDRQFGWSHHNYKDVEQIGRALGRVPFNVPQSAPLLYGPRTQDLRADVLNGKWIGWGSPGDPDPRVFLTEGGAALDRLPGFEPSTPTDPGDNPNTATRQKRLQRASVGGAAEALKRSGPGRAGRGVQMFTNFLFFDNFLANYSGLLDQYALARDRFGGPLPQNLSSDEYKRPSYSAWTDFGF